MHAFAKNLRTSKPPCRRTRTAIAIASVLCVAAPASAQVTFDVIGPHEYDLPVNFKPFNVFVQYGIIQDGDEVWDADGDEQSVPETDTLIGLSKYVRFWTPESNPNIGLAYEIIVPEVGLRNNDANTSTGGIGDPITGPAIWFKPTPNSTLGFQAFAQIPIGDPDIGGGDQWKYYLSPLWDIQFGKVSYSADAGALLFGRSSKLDGRQKTLWFTGHRLGYRVSDVVEPFLALDYESQRRSSINPKNDETTVGIGVMFHYYGNQSLTFRYSVGIDGESHSNTDSFNIKYVYSW